MFSSIKRFGSIVVTALIACASSVASGIGTAFKIVEASAIYAVDRVASAMVSVARTLPSLAPKRPTGTAAERQRLIPSTTYARTQEHRRRPTVLPCWRMCSST